MLAFKAMKLPVNLDIIRNNIECIPDQLGREDAEKVGNGDKQDPEQEPPFITEKEFIEVPE